MFRRGFRRRFRARGARRFNTGRRFFSRRRRTFGRSRRRFYVGGRVY